MSPYNRQRRRRLFKRVVSAQHIQPKTEKLSRPEHASQILSESQIAGKEPWRFFFFVFVFDLILFPALLHIFVSPVGQNTRTRFGGYHFFFFQSLRDFSADRGGARTLVSFVSSSKVSLLNLSSRARKEKKRRQQQRRRKKKTQGDPTSSFFTRSVGGAADEPVRGNQNRRQKMIL